MPTVPVSLQPNKCIFFYFLCGVTAGFTRLNYTHTDRKMQKRQQAKTRTSTTSTTSTNIVTVPKVYAPPDYKPFPHPRTALRDDFLRWAEEGAYLIMYDSTAKEAHQYRYLHKDCESPMGPAAKSEMIAFSKRQPIIVLDLSRYPTLAHENEWETVLKQRYPEYKTCLCPWFRCLLYADDINRHYYRLCEPYFFLAGMNCNPEESLKDVRLISEIHPKIR